MTEEDLKSFRDRFGVPIPDDRIADAIAEGFQILLGHLLLLVRDVLAFAGVAETVAFDRARKNDRRAA